MSLEIVPRVGFILTFFALETIRAGRSVNVDKLSSFCRPWILPDCITLFLDNLLCRPHTDQTLMRSEMLGELVRLAVEMATAHTGEHRAEVAGELVGLERLRSQKFILTGLTGHHIPPLSLMNNQMFLNSSQRLKLPLADSAGLLVRNVILDMK